MLLGDILLTQSQKLIALSLFSNHHWEFLKKKVNNAER